MANEFVARNGIIALDSSIITGSLTVTNGITGSLLGTSSWAVSSSRTITSSYALSASNALTSSFAFTAVSSSYALSGSYVLSASNAFSASNAVTASNASTSSYAFSASNAFNAVTASHALTVIPSNQIASGSVSAIVDASGSQIFRIVSASNSLLQFTSNRTLLVGDTVVPSETAWRGTGVFGVNGTSKVITGYLGSSTNGAIIGGHNSALNAWADLNIAGINLIFRSSETEFMRLTSIGNLGIGTTAPAALFSISSSTAPSVLRVDTIGRAATLFITGSGNIGIGTAAPTALLTLDSAEPRIRLNRTGTQHMIINHDGTTGTIRNESNTPLQIGTNGAAVMTITGSNVGIGTTFPTSRLQVSGSENTVNVRGSGSAVFSVDGTLGRLFQVDDSLSGSLFSVNTAAGLPIIEAFSDNTVRIGQFGQRALFVSQSRVGIGKESLLNGILDVSGSVTITGSLNVNGSITGSLFGSSSYALSSSNAITASFAFTASHVVGTISSASYVLSASNAQTASFAFNAISSSYALSASNAQTSSFGFSALSASIATQAVTASSADNFLVRGTLTAQTIVAQVITSSTDFITGSTRFGSIITNTHQFTGSVSVSGSLSVNNTISATSEYRLDNLPYARVASINTSNGSFGGGYNFDLNNGSPRHDSTGTMSGYYYSAAGIIFYTSASAPAGTAATQRMVIDNAGNVGIGTTSPSARLAVELSGAANQRLANFRNTGGNSFIEIQSSGVGAVALWAASGNEFGIYQNATAGTIGTSVLYINSSGNVGMGTTAPGAYLDIRGINNGPLTASLQLRSGNDSNNFSSNQILFGYANTSLYRHAIKTRHNTVTAGNAIDFYTWLAGSATTDIGGQHVMSLDGTNVGIGTTSPAALLQISSSTATAALRVDTAGGAGALFVSGSGNIGVRMITPTGSTLTVNGNIWATSLTGSLLGTASWASNAITSSFILNAVSASYALSASNTLTSSFTFTAVSASYALSASHALTASSVNTLSQNVLITGSLTVGASTAGSSENTLTLGGRGNTEGGQLMLQSALSSSYTSASMFDVYADQGTGDQYVRILRGNNAGSDALVAQFNLQTKQFNLPAYVSSTSFTGTAAAFLAVTNTGAVITTSGSGGSGLSGGATNYIARWASSILLTTGSLWDNGTNVGVGNQAPSFKLDVSGDVRATGAVYANANGAMYFRGGDDAEFWDINVANTVGIYGQQNQDRAGLKLGSSGPTLFGSGSNLGIGMITPTGSTVTVNGNVWATSFTGSLLGSSSYALSASNALTSSVAFNAISSSYALSASNALTSSFGFSALSASIATQAVTASSADNFTVRNTLTATTIVVQTITSSQDFVTGSTRFGTLLSNTHQFTGSVSITGSLSVVGAGITGSLFGSSSYALSASNAFTSSYAFSASNAFNAVSSSYALSASNALTSSFAINAANAFIQNGNSFGAQAVLGTNDAQNLAFETNGTVRMLISGSGANVGIGTTTIAAGALLHINGYATTANNLGWCGLSTGGNIVQLLALDTSNRTIIGTVSSGTVMTLTGSSVGIGTSAPIFPLDVNGTGRFTSIIETSTRTLKDNINPYPTEISTFKQLEPVTFTWKDTGKEDVGLIAEDVEKLFPEFVSKTDSGEVTGINYGKLSVIFINVLKQQQARIELLEEQIKKLTS